MAVRVAVIGVRGVGKFHAQWFAHEGAEVVAFVASRPETLAANEAALRQVVPQFRGRGYADVADMLAAERPDAVSVCSPHHLHAEHALLALQHGAHVLCEKPLVWLGEDRIEDALQQARQVVAEAQRRRLCFAINTQYAAAVPHLQALVTEKALAAVPQAITLTMEARMRDRDTAGTGLWVDLAPHPLSLLIALFPAAHLDAATALFEEAPRRLTARFQVRLPEAKMDICVRLARLDGTLERSIAWNGFVVRFEPHRDERGVFHTRLCWDDGERIADDFMRVSVRQFLAAVEGRGSPLCDGAAAVRQTEWLFALLRRYLRR